MTRLTAKQGAPGGLGVLLMITILPGWASGQVVPAPAPSVDSVSVTPAAYCTANRLFSALAGAGYRRLWATPIRVPVADMGVLGGGGVTPVRVGGGVTTQTLHLDGADGRRYVFRSVRKTTRQALSEEFWGTPVEAIMRDQLCSFHPSGAVVVARLVEAVGVLHPEPALMVVPDDPRLGEFREQFAGMLVLFEERPDDRPDGKAGFAGSRRIVQIENLFDDLEESPEDRIAAEELLKSRLVDILVGDRDRSINNHLWAHFELEEERHLWRPIPRDRDQSFVRFDGIVKTLGRWYEPRLVSFSDQYPNIEGLTRNAWDIDRNLLVGLDRARWDAVVNEVRLAITDQVIAEAVRRMPREHFDLVGEEMERALISRRDNLAQAGNELYRIVFREADVHATDEDETAVLTWETDGSLRVSVASREGGPESDLLPHFQRTFSPEETRELRLYMHGGDDLVRLEGTASSRIVVRIIGGGGDDEVSDVTGEGRVYLFDDDEDTRVQGSGITWVREDAPRPYSWWVDGREGRDFGSEARPELSLSYDGDRGFVISAGFLRERYAFLKDPFGSRLQVKAGWAVSRSEPILDYRHVFRRIGDGIDLRLHGRYSGFEVVRFYGLGNETEPVEAHEYYEAHQKQLILRPSLGFRAGHDLVLSVGPVMRWTDSDTTDPGTFVTDSRAYGSGEFLQAGLEAWFEFDTRDIRSAPSRGYHLTGGGSFYPAGLDVEGSFGEAHLDASTYLSPESGNPTLALRVGGKRLWGTFPYSDAAFLGGSEDLRGLREQRFAGDAAVYGNLELRVFLTRFLLLFPVDFGVFGLTDVGRVFLDGESSDQWYHSLGGGVWFAPVTRSATVQVSMAQSEGRRGVYVGMGFAF